MYNEYFGFKEAPFSIAPNPQFLYMSERHREALAHLIYGMKTDGGFVLLTGEIGTGKTTICQCLLEQVPDNSEVAYVINPKLDVVELLATICDELEIAYPAETSSNKALIDIINVFLLDAHSRGSKTVLIIDEAQNLSFDVLEQIRLLTNLETSKQKLLQVIMLGQPELKTRLERPEMRQLAQRITARYHLEPLSKDEIQGYVCHRLAVAGADDCLIFPVATTDKLYKLSDGVPRLINLLCDRALLGAYVNGQHIVSTALLHTAAQEVFGKKVKSLTSVGTSLRFIFLLVGLTLVGGFFLLPTDQAQQLPPVIVPPTPAPIVAIPVEEPLTWTNREPVIRSNILAYQALFVRWGQVYNEAQGSVTNQAQKLGLKLTGKHGSLGRLRQLNRPAVLKLRDPQGNQFYATLIALNHNRATLVLAGEEREISVDTLNKQWLGEFTLLWQVPPNYSGALKPGAQGQAVAWLEKQMATLHGRNIDASMQPALKGLLLKEVQQFQAKSGLKPDGIVGTYTLILLNNKIGLSYPTLNGGQSPAENLELN